MHEQGKNSFLRPLFHKIQIPLQVPVPEYFFHSINTLNFALVTHIAEILPSIGNILLSQIVRLTIRVWYTKKTNKYNARVSNSVVALFAG